MSRSSLVTCVKCEYKIYYYILLITIHAIHTFQLKNHSIHLFRMLKCDELDDKEILLTIRLVAQDVGEHKYDGCIQ